MKKKNREERKQVLCNLLTDPLYVPMKEKELAVLLQVKKEDRELLHETLEELLKEGKIEQTKRGKYRKPEEEPLIGTFISHPKGFGFVEIEGREQDLYIPEGCAHGAFLKDTVEVALLPAQHGKRQEAEVVKVISHSITTVVGTYEQSKNYGFVICDNTKMSEDIFIPKERSKGAVTGHKVVAEITDYGKDGKKPEGKVLEILGHMDDPGVDIMAIMKGFDLPVEFSERTLNQAERVPDCVQKSDFTGRRDLRGLQMVTIDGEDAKDLDDAVSLAKEGDNFLLGVHIADVSNYVQEGSALDKEALERGTSVYLVDRVIPMLPHQLSNGICSLNQGVDRLAMSCMMTIDSKGTIIDYELLESVICVNQRMSYTDVARILEDKDKETIERYKELVPMFREMKKAAALLRKKRKKRGSIDFDFPESKMILDREGHPLEIKAYERNVATKMIEDFMLAANETVAQHFYWQELPFIYRTHDTPDSEKIQKLASFIRNFGYTLKTVREEVHPKELQKLLAKIDGTPEEALISRLTLRSMKQAKYTVECTGHFGLACDYYCHFTSPIRRYPDLQIHRIIKDSLRGRMKAERVEKYKNRLPQVAKHSSEMERRADEAERETNKLKKVEFMSDKIGEIYEGVISGITGWGVYVELPNTVEGMIRAADLPGDYYHYKEESYEMVGQGTGKTYKLGQTVKIQVKSTDVVSRNIDFVIPEEDEE